MWDQQQQWWQKIRERWDRDQKHASLPDPELLLARAQQEMRELHAKNRERAVQAITQKNNLQQMVDDLQKRVDNLHAKAQLADERGHTEMAVNLRHEASNYEVSLESCRQSLASAEETAEAVKQMIKRQEEQIRQKTSEALILKMQWKQVAIEQSLTRALTDDSVIVNRNRLSRAQLRAHLDINRERASLAEKNRDDLAQFVTESTEQVFAVQGRLRAAQEHGDEESEMHLLRVLEQSEATLVNAREAWERAAALAERVAILVNTESEWLAHHGELFETVAPWQNAEDLLTPNEDADDDLRWFRWLAVGILVIVMVIAVVLCLLL